MYTVSKGPSKIVAKTRRGLSKNYEKFETIREIGKKPPPDINNLENFHVPRPVFQTTKKSYINNKQTEEEVITPQHEEIVNYIHESWSMIVADNPYDKNSSDANNNSTTDPTEVVQLTSPLYCTEPPSPLLNNFKPFDLESWWGRRLFNNITKSL